MASQWQRLKASRRLMGQTGLRALETLEAAQQVIAARTPIINAAFASPMTGDHRELAKMVPEKVDAFTRAGMAGVAAWWSAHSTWTGHMQYLNRVAMRGRPPTPSELFEFNDRVSALGLETVEASAKLMAEALAPIHGAVIANARRLSRSRR